VGGFFIECDGKERITIWKVIYFGMGAPIMNVHPLKLKEPVRQHRLFQLLWRRRREITYEANFITSLPNPLDGQPTSAAR
jgi:hypothetical protein